MSKRSATVLALLVETSLDVIRMFEGKDRMPTDVLNILTCYLEEPTALQKLAADLTTNRDGPLVEDWRSFTLLARDATEEIFDAFATGGIPDLRLFTRENFRALCVARGYPGYITAALVDHTRQEEINRAVVTCNRDLAERFGSRGAWTKEAFMDSWLQNAIERPDTTREMYRKLAAKLHP